MISRRDFTAALVAVPPVVHRMRAVLGGAAASADARIRAVTAGVTLESLADVARLDAALRFLDRARAELAAAGYEVQTVRVAVAWPQHRSARAARDALLAWQRLDRMAAEQNAVLSTGPVNGVLPETELAEWISDLISATTRTSTSVAVSGPAIAPEPALATAAAQTIARLAASTPQGLGNFRFAAAAHVPAGTPFFPVAWHEGAEGFSVGFEGAGLVTAAFRGARTHDEARERLRTTMDTAFAPVERLATAIASRERRRYLGIDASPAPGLDRSIGEAIETLTGRPFGSSGTLAACALITDTLRSLVTRTCGYSGLMLPVLEDPVLARRAAEGRYGLDELLLYSSVCGTGLDVVAVPGETPVERLAAVIADVAALAVKWSKPLSARLLPVPGRAAGEPVHFDDPLLTDSVVLPVE